ncbi:MAG: hypothetical protein K2J05_04955, partial [Muribaculaceae bacterium]|nr:hypothetical protein [Muribaculaceae bacterium]
LGLTEYLRSTGMTNQLVPTMQAGKAPRTDRSYAVIRDKYLFGGADAKDHTPYFDETARRMLFSVRNSMVETASQLLYEGDRLQSEGKTAEARKQYEKAIEILDLMMERTPQRVGKLDMYLGLTAAQLYCEAGKTLGDKKLTQKGLGLLEQLMEHYASYVRYNAMINSLYYTPSLTYDSKMTPFQYYRMLELYEEYGGKREKADEYVAMTGIDRAQLKQYYDMYTNPAAFESRSDDLSASEVVEELSKYCEIANHLSTLDATEYAATSDDERYVDSMLYSLLEVYEREPETLRLLKENGQWQKLDRSRSQRLSEEFGTAHPELMK